MTTTTTLIFLSIVAAAAREHTLLFPRLDSGYLYIYACLFIFNGMNYARGVCVPRRGRGKLFILFDYRICSSIKPFLLAVSEPKHGKLTQLGKFLDPIFKKY